MRLPGFDAETSLYKTTRHYRMGVKFAQANETLYPALSINDFVKSSIGSRYTDILNPWKCYQDCISSFPCADESCRIQVRFNCSRKCDVYDKCPSGQARCEGQCCQLDEVCTLDGCAPSNAVCNNRICFGTCLPDGCCLPGRTICNNRCCEAGWSCTSEGCCPPGVCCESAMCPPGKSCCGGQICCRDGIECKLVNGTSEYGCFS